MWSRILTSIGLDATGFEAGAKRVESAVSRMGGAVNSKLKGAIAGAFSVGAVAGFTKMTADAANRIQDLADQFELTTDQVQELDFAAKQVGSSFDDVGTKLDKLAASRKDAIDGNEALAISFTNLGVNILDLKDESKSALDLLKQMSDAGSGSRTDLMAVFGKGGGKMANVLQSMRENAGQGVFFDEKDIQSIDKFTEALDKAVTQLEGRFAKVVGGVADNIEANADNNAIQLAAEETFRNRHGNASAAFHSLFNTDKFKAVYNETAQLDADSRMPIRSKKQQDIETNRKQGDIEFARELITTRGELALRKEIADTEALRLDLIFKASTKEEQRFQLTTKQLELEMKLIELQSQDGNDAAMQAEKVKRELLKVNSDLTAAPFTGKADGFSADSLAKVGGFVGGAGSYDPSLTVATESFRVLQSIDRHLQEIRQANGAPNGNLNNQFAN